MRTVPVTSAGTRSRLPCARRAPRPGRRIQLEQQIARIPSAARQLLPHVRDEPSQAAPRIEAADLPEIRLGPRRADRLLLGNQEAEASSNGLREVLRLDTCPNSETRGANEAIGWSELASRITADSLDGVSQRGVFEARDDGLQFEVVAGKLPTVASPQPPRKKPIAARLPRPGLTE